MANAAPGPGRAAGYGRAIPGAIARANANTIVALQIETLAALDALDEILDVAGVDLLFIGPGDLGVGLEAAGKPEALPHVIDRILQSCTAAGRLAGLFAMTPEGLAPYAGRIALGIVGSDASVLAAGFDATFGAGR